MVELPGVNLFFSMGRQSSEALVAQARSIGGTRTPEGGKPAWDRASVSRASDVQVVALGRDALGVDIETLARVAQNARADDPWLSPEDRRFLRHDPADGIGELAARWVLREAYGKALGIGLALPLDSLTFARSATGQLRLRGVAPSRGSWRFGLYRTEELVIGLAHRAP